MTSVDWSPIAANLRAVLEDARADRRRLGHMTPATQRRTDEAIIAARVALAVDDILAKECRS